jgi:hypothetical protein
MNSERTSGAFAGPRVKRARTRGLGVALLAAALLLGARTVHAEPSADAAYRDLVDQALGEFKHKHWPEARVLFARAHELHPNARTLRGLGVVSFEMREYVSAVVYLQQALDESRQALTDAQRGECVGLITRARTYIGGYAVALVPETASLLVDGAAPARAADGEVLLAFGEHTLAASAAGYQELTRRIQVQGGERVELRLVLSPELPPEPVPPPLALTVEEPAAGAPGQREAPPVSASREPYLVRTGGLKYTWVALGAGVVFGGLAGGAWFMGDQEFNRLKDSCRDRAASGDPCVAGDTNTKKITRYEKLTNAGIGLSAVSAVTAAVLLAVEWPRERRISVALSPQSISLRGAF